MTLESGTWSYPAPKRVLSVETHLRAAAERGDTYASWRLGRALLATDDLAQEALRWLAAAARAGHREARICLGWLDAGRKLYDSANRPEVNQWFRRTAASGTGGLADMASYRDREDALLRELAAAGDDNSARHLALAARRRRDTDAMVHWYGRAAELGDGASALLQGEALEEQGRLEEAEAVYRRLAASLERLAASLEEAQAVYRRAAAPAPLPEFLDMVRYQSWRLRQAPSRDMVRYQLRRLLERQGKPVPADLQHTEPDPPADRGDASTIVATAVVTTALVPFIQTLATKAAEQAYGAARSLISRLLHPDQRATNTPPPGPVLHVLRDSQSDTLLELSADRLDDEALHALTLTDLEALAAPDPAGRTVTIRWDNQAGLWRRHVDEVTDQP
jgi:tetratricopeptide (TPR) repeat protein